MIGRAFFLSAKWTVTEFYILVDRLWIQRVPPKPPKKSAKRKATQTKDNRKTKVARVEQQSQGKKREQEESSNLKAAKRAKKATTPQRTRRVSQQPSAVDDMTASPGGSGRARAAKTQANAKLDLQAKQLAAVKAEMDALNRKSTSRKSPAKPSSRPTIGVRMSRRLRGGGGADDEDDEWQPIPEEWLSQNEGIVNKSVNSAVNGSATRTRARNTRQRKEAPRPVVANLRVDARSIGLSSDDESDLTELSESEESDHRDNNQTVDEPSTNEVACEQEKIEEENHHSEETLLPPGFVEWETVCMFPKRLDLFLTKFSAMRISAGMGRDITSIRKGDTLS